MIDSSKFISSFVVVNIRALFTYIKSINQQLDCFKTDFTADETQPCTNYENDGNEYLIIGDIVRSNINIQIEIRKAFIPEIYETFTPYPDVNSINDILHIILRGSSNVNYNRIGKFLSLVLVNTQDLLIEVERDKGYRSRN